MRLKSPKAKGSDFERKVVKTVNKRAGKKLAFRIPLSGGGSIAGDIGFRGELSNYLGQAKKRERMNIWKAIKEAKRDAGVRDWIVFFSRNFDDIYVCLSLEKWMDLEFKGPEKC